MLRWFGGGASTASMASRVAPKQNGFHCFCALWPFGTPVARDLSKLSKQSTNGVARCRRTSRESRQCRHSGGLITRESIIGLITRESITMMVIGSVMSGLRRKRRPDVGTTSKRFTSSGKRDCCGRGSVKFLPFAPCAIAVARRRLPRRPRHLRGSSAPRRPQSLGRARRRRSGRRRASPTRSPTSSASSGSETLRAGRNALPKLSY